MFFQEKLSENPEMAPEKKIESEEKLAPLAPDEEKQLKELFELYHQHCHGFSQKDYYLADKAVFDISQMGERIIPFLLSDEIKNYRDSLSTHLKGLLDTVVSKKTAPLVLSAMEQGKIRPWYGALAAAKMGKEALERLGHLLENLEPGSSDGRSGQVGLIQAISVLKDDGAIPFFKFFFERVQNAEDYKRDFKVSDAYEIMEALCRINTPAAKAYIEEFSALTGVAKPTYMSSVNFGVIKPPQEAPDFPKEEIKKINSYEKMYEKAEKPKELTPKEKLFSAVEKENPNLRPFIEGKLTVSQSLAEAISSRPMANYIRIAKLLEEEGSPENKVRSGVLIGQYSSFIAQKADLVEREGLWRSFGRDAEDFQSVLMSKNSKAVMTYHQIKEILFGGAIGDKSGLIRKELTQRIIDLAENGNDEEISKTLSQIARQIGRQTKSGKTRLDPSQELALRGLFKLRDKNANTELARLLINEEVNPSFKKLCLKNLVKKDYFSLYEVQELARQYLKTDSRKIPWGELIFPLRIHLIADKGMRMNIEEGIFPQFISYFTKKRESMHNKWRESGRNIPPELFVVCWVLTDGEKKHMKYLNEMFGQIKSKALRESYLFALTEFRLSGYRPDSVGCFKKIISLPHDKDFPQIMLRILTNSIAITSPDRLKKISSLFFSARDPRLLLKKVETEAQEQFLQYLNVGKFDIALRQIRKLLDEMADPRPFFIYAAKLFGREQVARDLFKETIQHFDHPELADWKKWKYSRDDLFAREQLKALSDQQVQAYSRDRFVEVEELLASILPAEKARNIQESVMHGFLHDDHWKLEGDKSNLRFIFARLHEFFKTRPSEEAIFIENIGAEISRLNRCSDALSRFGLLLKDESLSARAEETIGRFQKQKSERAQRLRSLGLKGEESDDDLASIIKARRGRYLSPKNEKAAELLEKDGKIANYLKLLKRLEYLKQRDEKKEEKQEVEGVIKGLGREFKDKLGKDFQRGVETFRFIRSLSALRQPEFDPDFSAFLKKWKLDEASTNEQAAKVKETIRQELAEIKESDLLKDVKDFFGTVPDTANEMRDAAQNINIARNILRLTVLTPRLIVFDRISQDLPKKSLSLSKVIEDLQKKFAAYPKLSKDFSQISEKLQEISAPWKEEKMAMVVTDHPLVALTIGKYPYGAESCQEYSNGSRELLSYMTDASTKFNLLIDVGKLPEDLQEVLAGISPDDEDARVKIFNKHVDRFLPAIVARRVLKLVKNTEDGRPYCFLEPAYTPLDRRLITNHMDNFAKTELAPNFGFAVVKGAKSQDEGAFYVKVEESRNKLQYEDGESGGPGGGGGGLGTKIGSYTMPAKFIG